MAVSASAVVAMLVIMSAAAVFAAFALVLAVLFALVFKYKHNPNEA